MEPLSEFLTGFFAYNEEMNRRIEPLILQDLAVPEKALLLYSHSLNAHHIWNHRILGYSPIRGVWDLVNRESAAAINKANHDLTLEILAAGNLGAPVEYTNTKGETFVNTRQDILLHVVNHTTYHRGQIASALKGAGIEPPVTDYIFFKRSRL